MIAENSSNAEFSVEMHKTFSEDKTIRYIKNDVMAEQKINLIEHLEELKSGELLLEQVKNKRDIGIGREMLSEKVLCKTGEELIGDSDIICELREYRSVYVYHILDWKLSQYQWGEWITCLYFKLFLNFTVPMLSKVLEQNPLITGAYFRGEFCTAS